MNIVSHPNFGPLCSGFRLTLPMSLSEPASNLFSAACDCDILTGHERPITCLF